MIYLIGSLKSAAVPAIAEYLRQELKQPVFDDWHAAGPDADDYWTQYEKDRGHTLIDALHQPHANAVFNMDFGHLSTADMGVLVFPAGKSAHLELGYLAGRGKPTFILLDGEYPDRYDVMYRMVTGVHADLNSLVEQMRSCL